MTGTTTTTAAAVPSLAHSQQGAPFEAPLLAGSKEWALHEPAAEVGVRVKECGAALSAMECSNERVVALLGRRSGSPACPAPEETLALTTWPLGPVVAVCCLAHLILI